MSQFSRLTVIAAINVIEGKVQADITEFLLRAGRDVHAVAPRDGTSARDRMNALIIFIDDNPEYQADDGTKIKEVVIREAVSMLPSKQWEQWTPKMEEFRHRLEQDGFVITEGNLTPTLPADINLPEIKSELLDMLGKYEFAITETHLDQAVKAHARGDWEAANGQFRTSLEALLDEIAIRLIPNAEELASGQPRGKKLAEIDFLKVSINEWRCDSRGFINGLFKRLHSHGSHPGISDKDESTFRLHVVLLTAGLLMRRFRDRQDSQL